MLSPCSKGGCLPLGRVEEQAAGSQDLLLLQITPDFLEALAWVHAELPMVGWLGAVMDAGAPRGRERWVKSAAKEATLYKGGSTVFLINDAGKTEQLHVKKE